MTPLNTIIEEEKVKFGNLYVEVEEVMERSVLDKYERFLTTAIQRAYEAGCETSKWDMDNEYARGYNDGAYETRKLNSCAQPHKKKPTKKV